MRAAGRDHRTVRRSTLQMAGQCIWATAEDVRWQSVLTTRYRKAGFAVPRLIGVDNNFHAFQRLSDFHGCKGQQYLLPAY